MAARALVKATAVDRVIVADRDGNAAARVAAGLGPAAASIALDATDRDALVAALAPCDVVVNTIGPFFRFGVPILDAAIEAGTHYVDVCDDPEPTLRMLEFDDRARHAGVTALIGAGASPGVSNMLAVVARRALDTVDSVLTGWNIAAAHPTGAGPTAAVLHGMEQISGTVPMTRGGALVQRRPLERITFRYPGIGDATAWSFGHPEAVTLPRAYPGVRECINAVVADRATVAGLKLLRGGLDSSVLTPAWAARLAAAAVRLMPSSPATLLRPGAPPPLFAIATGLRDGRRETVATALAQIPGVSMAAMTGIPLVAATLRLVACSPPGVHTPESLLNPDSFFAALADYCIGSPAADRMTATTTSWNDDAANADALSTSLLTASSTPAGV